MRYIFLTVLALSFATLRLEGQSFIVEETLFWSEKPQEVRVGQEVFSPIWKFEGGVYTAETPTLPTYGKSFRLNSYSTLSVDWLQAEYAPLSSLRTEDEAFVTSEIVVQTSCSYEARQAYGDIRFIPIRRNPATGSYEKLTRFKLRVVANPTATPGQLPLAQRSPTISRLADGVIYKIAVNETGIYKLDYNFLRTLGVNVDAIDPRNIQILGNGGGLTPENPAIARPDDVQENAIIVVGEADGKFDAADYVLFYGQSPNKWSYNPANSRYFRQMHFYSNETYYFVKIGDSQGKRVSDVTVSGTPDYSTTTYDAYFTHEEEDVNLYATIGVNLPPSGRIFMGGENFKFTPSQPFTFNIPNLVTNEQVRAIYRVVARSIGAPSNFTLSYNGAGLLSTNLPAISGGIYSNHASSTEQTTQFTATGSTLPLSLSFSSTNSGAEGWLDYLRIIARAQLSMQGVNGQLSFRDSRAIVAAMAQYTLSAANANTQIWDVTVPYSASRVASGSGTLSFIAEGVTLKEFIAFDGTNYLTAKAVGKIDNQNLHGLTTPQLLIVYHPDFAAAAERLAAHRRSFSNMTVEAVPVDKVYNEFSSGAMDIAGIRDFARMLYDNGPADANGLRYLLLVGDGSFDYKNAMIASERNSSFIPVFETMESIGFSDTYTSDDFFAMLDDTDVNMNVGRLDIGVGRFAVRTLEQAQSAVDKVIYYETTPATFSDWRNRMTFLADDEESVHIDDTEDIAGWVADNKPTYNINKIYLDAYVQEINVGGQRIPGAQDELLRDLFKGTFSVCYLGHGGETGITQEQVFTNEQINALDNRDAMPLFITATCSFAPYDNPEIVSAGELLFENPNGAIAMLATTRVVYANANAALTQSVFEELFAPAFGEMPRLGDVLKGSKNNTLTDPVNLRKFALLGDPSMRLAYPRYNIETTAINGQVLTQVDTVGALERVTVAGVVVDDNGNTLTNFNGIVYPTVYDKAITIATLQNDGSPLRYFELQKNILFKGRASTTNGVFQFSFVVPRDINYNYGAGKISYYAENGGLVDAAGYTDSLIIGGTNANAIADNQGPEVTVFLNDENFAFGGLTGPNPLLLVSLYDENGINTTGNSIGHDLVGKLDEDNPEQYILNDFYEAGLDDYRRGEVRFPLYEIPAGRHSINVKAWDTYNNPGEGFTEFVVADDAELALDHVLNYPNPFTTHTDFQFEHNFPGQPLQVRVQIFSVAGRLIKTIEADVLSDGSRVTDIAWDGTDDYGDRIGRGVYIYRISARAEGVQGETTADAYEKLVILR